MGMLDGKVAIVTGASRGIGAAAARRLVEAGAAVALLARSADEIERLAEALRGEGHRAAAHVADVADHGRIMSATSAVADDWGGVDILVNNAGVVQPIGFLGDTDPGQWARTIEINLTGAYNAVHAALPWMLGRGAGTVINLSSGAAHRFLEGWSAYCVSKAGLAMMTQALHAEYAERGIRAFGFQPGVVDTEMQVEIRASGVNEVSRLPRTALAPADDPARAIVFLCTAAADRWAGADLRIGDPDLRAAAGLAPL